MRDPSIDRLGPWARLGAALAAIAAIGLGGGCLESQHCGYQMGDASCAERDPARPHCNLCVDANNGCAAAPPTDLECALASESGASASASASSTGGESSGGETASSSDASTSTTAGVSGSEATTATTGQTSAPTTSGEVTTTSTTSGEATTSTSEDSDGATTTTTTTSTSTGEPTTTSTTSTTTDPTTSTSTTSTSTGSTTMSEPVCGNGKLEGMELCDGGDLDGMVCADFPTYGGGDLECAMNCTFDLGGCCLANGQPCMNDAQCCPGKACKFDVQAFKNICK